jgi:hypothetical protein
MRGRNEILSHLISLFLGLRLPYYAHWFARGLSIEYIESPLRTKPRQGAACGARNQPQTALCLFRSSFWSFLDIKRRPYTSLWPKTLLYMEVDDGMSLPRLWRRLPPPGLRAAIAAMGPGLVFIFCFNSFMAAINLF